MTYQDFVNSVSFTEPPSGISELLLALWYDARGDWESAHNIAQKKEGTREYDRLHAYLHRVEGDQWNAGYWYRRAGEAMPERPLKEEWEELVKRLLSKNTSGSQNS